MDVCVILQGCVNMCEVVRKMIFPKLHGSEYLYKLHWLVFWFVSFISVSTILQQVVSGVPPV